MALATQKLELVHSDVGTMPVDSKGGSRYFVTFTDDKTRYRWCYTMKRKADFDVVFQSWRKRVEMESGFKLQRFRSDGGGEYISTVFIKELFNSGVKHEITPAATPEMNGVAERLNRTLVESTKSILYEAELEDEWWAEAIMTVTYLTNLSPTAALQDQSITPFEAWKGIKPDLSHLRIFGSECWVHVPKALRKKLDDHARKGVFVGYGDTRTTYRVAVNGRVAVYRDVRFNEQII